MARLNIDNEEVKKYIFSLSEKLMRHFDLEYQINKENEYFDLYAKNCTLDNIEEFQDMLIRLTPILSNPNKFHKRSIITGIIITDISLEKEWEKIVKKFFYRVSYKLSFHGWSETEYAIVSIKDKNVYLPKMRKKELKNLLLNF